MKIYEDYKQSIRDRTAKYRKANRIKVNARRAVARAIRSGSILKQTCHCGEWNVEAHHSDYTKALEVVWLCKKHHAEADKRLKIRL